MSETYKTLEFPIAGADLSKAYSSQMVVPMPGGEYGKTCRVALNVRGYDLAGRRRGGTRPPIEKYIESAAVEDYVIQELAVSVGAGFTPPGGLMQQSQSGRVVTLVLVSQGQVYTIQPGGDTWTQATNSTGQPRPLRYSGIVASTSLNQKVYFADAGNYTYYDPSTDECLRWMASAGAMPGEGAGSVFRLICTWRGRAVVSGIESEPQNWFMSRVGDPTDWEYFPAEISPDQAVAGNNSPLGLIGDVVTSLIPYTDDVLIFGCDHEIHMMRGDPMAGGQIDRVSHAIGMAWGSPWAMDPYGAIYFVSNRMGIYRLVPGQKPERISQQIEQLLQAYNSGQMTIRLAWDDKQQGLCCFFTYTSTPTASTHQFWDMRSGGWFPFSYVQKNHNPLCCCTFDGNRPDDRVTLIGSWDGYVRTISGSGTDDDGYPIRSKVVLGPMNTKELDDVLFKNVQGVLSEDSGEVTYKVYVGSTAEIALSRDPVAEGTWGAGRNLTNLIQRAGHALYLKLESEEPWAMESIRASIEKRGLVRMRGR